MELSALKNLLTSMPSASIISLVVSVVVSVISLTVSAYLVWLSQLRGATIKHLEVPTIKIQEPPQQVLRTSPESIIYLNTEEFSIIFTNSGNRAGIIKDIRYCIYSPFLSFSCRAGVGVR